MAKAQGKAKGGKPAASTTTTRKTASKATASRKSGKPAAKKPAAREPAARAPAAKPRRSRGRTGPAPEAKCLRPSARCRCPPKRREERHGVEVDGLLDNASSVARAAIVIELGDYKDEGRHAIVVPATEVHVYEAVDAALDAPLSEHGVEGYNLSVRDCYVDQDCDGMWVTEVTEDTVTAACQYCS